MTRQLPNTVTFRCSYGNCTAQVTTLLGSKLETFNICQKCFDARYATGMKAKLEAEAKERKSG